MSAKNAQIRFFLHTEPVGWEAEPTPLMDHSFAYLGCLRDIAPVRALPMVGFNVSREHPRWEPYEKDFSRELDDKYINIVIGTPSDVAMHWTDGVSNIAILLECPSVEEELRKIHAYDEVTAPTMEIVNKLRAKGIPALCMPTEYADVRYVLARYCARLEEVTE